jgi:hypothetical protein
VLILLLRAYQPGLFDAVVPVKGHATKTGTYVQPYQAKRKKRPDDPSGDLFAEQPKPEPKPTAVGDDDPNSPTWKAREGARSLEEFTTEKTEVYDVNKLKKMDDIIATTDWKTREAYAESIKQRIKKNDPLGSFSIIRMAQTAGLTPLDILKILKINTKKHRMAIGAEQPKPLPKNTLFPIREVSAHRYSDDYVVIAGSERELQDWVMINGLRRLKGLGMFMNRSEGGYMVRREHIERVLPYLTPDRPRSPEQALAMAVEDGKRYAEELVPGFAKRAESTPEVVSAIQVGYASVGLMEDLKSALRARTKEGTDAARAYVFSEDLPVTRHEADTNGKREREVQAAVCGFAEIFGTSVKVKSVNMQTDVVRSCYDTTTGVVEISPKIQGKVSTEWAIYHEFGHALEQQHPDICGMAQAFLLARAGPNRDVYSLSEIKNHNYKENEMAYRGRYRDAYVGKIYADLSTEVISMMSEEFRSTGRMAAAYKEDPEQFYLALAAARIGVEASKPKTKKGRNVKSSA